MNGNGISRRTLLSGAAGAAGLIATAACSTAMPAPASARYYAPNLYYKDRRDIGQQIVADIRAALHQGQPAVAEALERIVSDPRRIIAELDDPRPNPKEPEWDGSTQLYVDSSLTIFHVQWNPNAYYMPHDHEMWASVGIYSGRQESMMWRRKGDTIEPDSFATIGEGEVYSMPVDGIHSVVNPVDDWSNAIHVYGGDLMALAPEQSQWDPRKLKEQPLYASPEKK